MNTNEFNIYWKQYIEIEKELNDILKYVTLSEENYNTFSDKFVKILLEIGSEIDVVIKEYCKEIDSSFSGANIDKYRECIMRKNFKFF